MTVVTPVFNMSCSLMHFRSIKSMLSADVLKILVAFHLRKCIIRGHNPTSELSSIVQLLMMGLRRL